MSTRVIVGIVMAAVAVRGEAANIESRCAAAVATATASQEDRSHQQAQCVAKKAFWLVVDRWERAHGVLLPGATVAPVLREYLETQAEFAPLLFERPGVPEALAAALDEYLTNLVTKSELEPLSDILDAKLGLGQKLMDFPHENHYGVIRVMATPSDAEVYIDAEIFTSTLQEYAVPVGQHDVVVRKVTFLDCAQKVKVAARAHVNVKCTLRPQH